MGKDRDIVSQQQGEEKLLKAGRCHVVRRLNQNVAALREREKVTGAESWQEIGDNVVIGPRGQLKGYPFLTQNGL